VFLATCPKKIRAGLPFPVTVVLLEQFLMTDFDVSVVSSGGQVIANAKSILVGKIKGI